MNNVYPSTEELMPELIRARLPALLCDEVEERYRTLGEKYVTDIVHEDGRYINGCMYKSSAQDAVEEVIDAVFNTLVWIFKINGGAGDQSSAESSWLILQGLIETYALLKAEILMENENASIGA